MIVEDVAVTVPLKVPQVLLVVTAAGLRLTASAQEVLPLGAHLTVARPLAEFVRNEPAIVYVAPLVHPVTTWYTPAPPEAT